MGRGWHFACPDTDSFSARCQNREGHSPLAIYTAVFVHVLVLLAAGFALCVEESINLKRGEDEAGEELFGVFVLADNHSVFFFIFIYVEQYKAEPSQVNTLPKANSKTRSKQNKDMHKCSSVYSERGVPLPVLTSGGE